MEIHVQSAAGCAFILSFQEFFRFLADYTPIIANKSSDT